MTKNDKLTAVVAAATLALGLVSAAAAGAQETGKKENVIQRANKNVTRALGKAGKATEYGARKAGEQVSVTTHRALGKKTVVRDRGKKQDYTVYPGGTKKPLPKGSKNP